MEAVYKTKSPTAGALPVICRRFALSLMMCWSTAASALQDAKKASASVSAESHMGAMFNEGPRQAAKLLPGQGTVKFPASTKAAEAGKFVEQGVGQLHGFYYLEAERSFRQAAALDPDCAIAYWGMAAANVNNRDRAKGFINEAAKRKAKASPRELRYIDAYHAFFTGGGDNKERNKKLMRDLEDLVREFPGDVEAKAFLALAIWGCQKDGNGGSIEAADLLCQQIFKAEPLHPAHHFVIHLWDTDGRAARALPSAAKCGDSGPGIAHMWHMSAHIYSKLHRYAEAAWQLEASARVDHAAMQRDRVMPYEIHNYAHNNDWLAKEYGKLGRVREALTLAYDLASLPRHPKFNKVEDGGSSAGFGRARLLELLPKAERWAELRDAVTAEKIPFVNDRGGKIDRALALGSASYMLGDEKAGDEQLALLEKISEEKPPSPTAADKKSPPADAKKPVAAKPGEERKGRRGDRPRRDGDARIKNAVAELKARRLAAKGDFKGALAALGGVELRTGEKARWLASSGDAKGAEALARKTVAGAENEVLPLATLVEVLHVCGNTDAAAVEFEKLATLAGRSDLDLPALKRLRPLAEALDFSGDWRSPAPMPGDFGARPPLESLGPVTFTPWTAPDFTVPTEQGGRFALEELRRKHRGVLVTFYLGSGCVHCVEQLQAFAPFLKKFDELGVPMVAISTEDREKLAASLKVVGKGESFPIGLASDSTLTLFKQYGVYDDFEKMPLHGTFLIDSAGKVRWRDVSYQPFTNPQFLLDEATRLLAPKQSPALPSDGIGGRSER
jgi:peroxiredoxin/tetratricopeptide (TPR) repeat protein